MIQTTALSSLGDDWKLINKDTKSFTQEQIADIKQVALTSNSDGKLDKAIAALDEFDTRVADSIKNFAIDNGFEYLGNIGAGYVKLGYERTASSNNSNGITMGSTVRAYIERMPAWMRGNSLPSIQVHAISGQIQGFSVLLFIDRVAYGYTGGDGEPLEPQYTNSGIIVVQLHKIFPQLVLDSNNNDKFFIKTRSAAIDSSQKIDLEANFSQYYDFYAPKGINANSLSVLSPNFMQMLIDSSAAFDVEFFGDKMYIITQDPLFSVSVMNDAINALEEQLRYMQRLEESWSYQPITSPFDVLKQTKVVNYYSLKIGSHRIGLIQLILSIFAIIFLITIFAPLIAFLSTILSL